MDFLNKTEHGNMTFFIIVVSFEIFAMKGGFSIKYVTKVLTIIFGFISETDFVISNSWIS